MNISGGSEEVVPRVTIESIDTGDEVSGFVQQVGADFLWVALSPSLRARVFLLDATDDIEVARKFTHHFTLGQHLPKCTIVQRNLSRRTLDLSLRKKATLRVDMVVPGRVVKVMAGSGLNVQLGARTFGRVHITDMRDKWVEEPLKGVPEGQLVQCKVTKIKGDRIDLSLRVSAGGCEAGGAKAGEVRVVLGTRLCGEFQLGLIVHWD